MMHLSVVGDVDLVQQLLLVAGDVETNPGPIPPGMLKSIVNDLRSMQQYKYKTLGLKLQLPEQLVQGVVDQFKGDSVRILTEMINQWLHYLQGEGYAEMFVNKDKQVDRICLTLPYSKQDCINTLCGVLREMDEEDRAEVFMKKCEHQQRLITLSKEKCILKEKPGLLQSLSQELSSVQDKYFSIGMELEVVLDEICKLEAKYQDNKAKIFSEVLQCWMDNCSRGDYIHDVCSALEAVGEADLAESLSKKYSHIDESPPTPPLEMEDKLVLKDQQPDDKEDEEFSGKKTSDKREASSDSHMEIPLGKKIREQSADSIEMSPLTEVPMNLECVDGGPQKQTGKDKIPARLVVTAPVGTPLKKLNDLNKTIQDNGDKKFPLDVNGDLANTCWNLIDWQVRASIVQLACSVDVTMTINLRRIVPISDGVKDIFVKGVTAFVSDALDNKYKVDVHYEPI